MEWDGIIRAVNGEPMGLACLMVMKLSCDAAVGAAMLLQEEEPNAAATLVVAGGAAWGKKRTGPVVAALAQYAAPALAAWRAAPDWAKRCIAHEAQVVMITNVTDLISALRDVPAALRDAVGIVVRDGDAAHIARALDELGAAGWRALDDNLRAALYARALQECPEALRGVWSDLLAAQREATVRRIDWCNATLFIGGIGAVAWATTDAALRKRLIGSAARAPSSIYYCAPAWDGMSAAERARLVKAVVNDGRSWGAYCLLDALGRDGRRALSDAQRGALDALVDQNNAWRTSLLRVADAGWDALSDAERRMLMERAEKDPLAAAGLIRAVGIAEWGALPRDVQATLHASVQQVADALFRCPPALWRDLADGRLPPPASITDAWVISQWRAEDAAADLSRLSPEHQALVLACAQWREADCVPSAPRMARLLVAWNAMTPGARVDLAAAHPWTLAVVAAAARLAACEPAITETSRRATDAVADTIAVMAQHAKPDAAARATVGRMLAAQRRWRSWMRAFAPTGGDPPDVWKPWIEAALHGSIPYRGIVLPLMARRSSSAKRDRFRRTEGG